MVKGPVLAVTLGWESLKDTMEKHLLRRKQENFVSNTPKRGVIARGSDGFVLQTEPTTVRERIYCRKQ